MKTWQKWNGTAFGRWLFSRMLGLFIPYTGTIGATLVELTPGHSRIRLCDRRRVRNHLRSIHAVALMNLGELTTGLCLTAALPAQARIIIKEFKIEYLKKARGTLTAEARTPVTDDMTKRDVQISADIRNAAGETVCKVTAIWQAGPPA